MKFGCGAFARGLSRLAFFSAVIASPLKAETSLLMGYMEDAQDYTGYLYSQDDYTGAIEPKLLPWMHADVQSAWSNGYKGQGANIYVVDDFGAYNPFKTFPGNLTGDTEEQLHGEWTSQQADLIAPGARIFTHDYNRNNFSLPGAVLPGDGESGRAPDNFSVINTSYGIPDFPGQTLGDGTEQTIVDYAQNGYAVVTSAAGNQYGLAVDGVEFDGRIDLLNTSLIGAPSVIFVGALDRNGSVEAPSAIADYSSIAGENVAVQDRFLVVGVEADDHTDLHGTSFAAPIVAGYAAIVHSKFSDASPTQVSSRLLDTARKDTIVDYSVSTHGQGEASLSRAMAPDAIN